MRPRTPPTEGRHTATEERLRAALAARAALVTHHGLRPAAPPRGRAWGTHRVYGLALAGLGTVAAVAAAYLLVLSPAGARPPVPEPPARQPGVVERPTLPPSRPDPAPAPVTPGVTSVPSGLPAAPGERSSSPAETP